MRRQFISTALAAAFVAASLPAPRAQGTAPRPKPKVTFEPRIEITPGLGPLINIVPDIHIELPDFDIQVPPVAPMPPVLGELAFPAVAPDVFISGDNVWFGGDDESSREETRQTYQLSAGARVELSHINGPVHIDTADGNTAEVRITTYSPAKDARKLAVEHTASSLAIRGAAKAERDRDWFGSTRHHVRLTLPRRVNLSVSDVSESVRVGELEGTANFANVSGRVGVAQAAGGAELTNVSGSVTMTLARLAGRGVTVKNVSGRVILRFLEDVNAELQTSGIRGKVYVEVPNVSVQGEMNKADFRAKVGAGGAPINVSDVSGSVRLSPGRTVAEMLTSFKSERSSARTQAVTDLALHVSNRQVRQAFVEAVNAPDQSGTVQLTAARELAPYVSEPEVRDAYLRALAAEPGKNDSLKTTAVRALAREYGNDKAVRDAMLRALAADPKGNVRAAVISAVAKHVADPAVTRAFVDVLKTDAKDSTRVRAASALSKRADDAEVYALLLEAARNDKNRSVRLQSFAGLARRIRERPELRELFVSYLDNESISFQYHALRGLVELNDASLRQRLVEKGREIVLGQGRRYWNDRMVLDTIILVRRLDPQEADRLLEQLSTERARAL
ncbi:MAG: HEAT repeat domain-containing protein [Acidobacteria bacterium]|nr:HEAT repeat domain-containing protein [Acidobacteriota bacterium]